MDTSISGHGMPTFEEYLVLWSEQHDGRPAESRLVRRWLRLVYAVASPLAARGVHPHLLTAGAVAASGGVAMLAPRGAPLVPVAGLLDGLDGCVAALSGRASPWGAQLDTVADRASDVLLMLGLRRMGAPSGLVVVAAAAVFAQESTRHRAAARGRVLPITPGERPTRLIVATLGMAAGRRCASPDVATAAVAVTAGLSGLSWLQLLRQVRSGRR